MNQFSSISLLCTHFISAAASHPDFCNALYMFTNKNCPYRFHTANTLTLLDFKSLIKIQLELLDSHQGGC